jgi:hypothetical protein
LLSIKFNMITDNVVAPVALWTLRDFSNRPSTGDPMVSSS